MDILNEAIRIIHSIAEQIEQQDSNNKIDIDIQLDILYLHTENGVFVINKHLILKEIWLSSPISGPHHFANINGKWLSITGINLFELLSTELSMTIQD